MNKSVHIYVPFFSKEIQERIQKILVNSSFLYLLFHYNIFLVSMLASFSVSWIHVTAQVPTDTVQEEPGNSLDYCTKYCW